MYPLFTLTNGFVHHVIDHKYSQGEGDRDIGGGRVGGVGGVFVHVP